MKATFARLWPAVSLAVCWGATLARSGDVPPRSAGGQTLEVPKEHLDLGEVYYVTPGEDTQLVCTSDAPLARLAVTCNRVVGYFVTPFEPSAEQSPLLAGAVRIPVAALQTGANASGEALRSPPALHAAEYPEITFRLLQVSNVKATGEENQRKRFTVTLAGEMTIKDKTVALEAPAELELIPFTWRTMARNVGELLTLRTHFDLKLADYGLEKPDRSYNERIADVIKVDVFLLCNTMSPEKNLDPRIKTPQFLKQLRFLTLVRDLGDPEKGYELGRGLLREVWDDAAALDRLASAVLSEDGIATRDLRFVLKAARRANEVTDFKDPSLLSTLGHVLFDMGRVDEAVERLRQATEHLESIPPPVAGEIRATLERYEREAERERE
jgi:polyisoprenoid-binding protein YceI